MIWMFQRERTDWGNQVLRRLGAQIDNRSLLLVVAFQQGWESRGAQLIGELAFQLSHLIVAGGTVQHVHTGAWRYFGGVLGEVTATRYLEHMSMEGVY